MSQTKTRFALVGAGGIGHAYAQSFSQCQHASLVAVADVSDEAAKTLGDKAGVPAFGSVDALLKSEVDFDATIVCTPPNDHEDTCCQLMAAGKHVLCEKPLSIYPTSARRMIAVSQENDVQLTMASKFRCVSDVKKAKEILDSGTIGDLILFENAFTSFVDMSGRWNSNPVVSGGGVLIDNGTHSLDLARFFMGPLHEVQVIEGKRIQRLPVDETITIFVRNREGAMGRMDLSWTINKNLPDYITIHGTKGTLSLGWQKSSYRIGDDDWVDFGSGYDKIGAFQTQLDNFALALQGEEELIIKPEDGLASVIAVEVAYDSLMRNNWVQLASPV
ncbi:MAG: Gfo/Idh/MocA family oxidoreductase, partial [Verrucomicrobiota bacterium]